MSDDEHSPDAAGRAPRHHRRAVTILGSVLAVAVVVAVPIAVRAGDHPDHRAGLARTAIVESSVAQLASPSISESPAGASPVTSNTSSNVRYSTQIHGAVTTASERALVISYIGGACDLSAHATAKDQGALISVDLVVTSSGDLCPAVGIQRSAVVELNAPWNGRRVVDVTGGAVPVIDDATLLHPTFLPANFVQGPTYVDASDGLAFASELAAPAGTLPSWPPNPSCQPGPAALEILQGQGVSHSGEPSVPGTYSVNGQSASATTDGSGATTLSWTPPGHPAGWSVSVTSYPVCQGDAPLSVDTLLKVAVGLQ